MKCITGIFIACNLLILSACIENDIPLPRIKAEILAIEAEGQIDEAVISTTNRTVRLTMDEDVNMQKIQLLQLELTEDAVIFPSLESTSVVDLSSTKEYVLTIYQDYVWTISADQPMERYFRVNNQVGEEYIDVKNKVAIAYVEEGTDLSSMTITGLKLGPSSPTGSIIPDYEKITDFTEPGGVTVVSIYHNIRDVWTLFVAYGETTTHSVDAWEKVAWLKGSGRSGGNNGFEYREASSENWITVDQSLITFNGGVFSARLSGLKEGQSYVSRSYSDEDYSDEAPFTLGTTQQLPNNSFENWHKPGKPWLIYGEDEDMYWDSGNHGSTTISERRSVTTPETTYANDGKYSAQLASDFIGAVGVGQFAAGNLFAGEYISTDGISGAILDFGRPFTKHPSKLTGWFRYEPGKIDYIDTSGKLPASLIAEGAVKGETDKAHIWVALRDAGAPIRINNRYRPEQLYHYKTDGNLIAYGELIQHQATAGNGLIPFEIELEYYHTDRTPTHISIVCSASKYGDYFTGSTSSILWLDNFELVYD